MYQMSSKAWFGVVSREPPNVGEIGAVREAENHANVELT